MSIKVSRLAETDIPGAVSAIQVGFAGDPYKEWMFDEAKAKVLVSCVESLGVACCDETERLTHLEFSKFNPKRNDASLGARCRWGIRNALFYVAKEEGSDQILGIAMWLSPRPAGQKQSWAEWLEEWKFWFSQVGVNLWYGRGGLNVKRYYIFKDAQKRAHKAFWTDPRGYYFLNIIAVMPEARGRGIGRDLVAVITEQADRERMPCYLESSKERPNMDIYESWGFRFAGEMGCDDDGAGCKLFCMIRDPQPVDQAQVLEGDSGQG